jgi:hypothetical protein
MAANANEEEFGCEQISSQKPYIRAIQQYNQLRESSC